MSGRVCVPFFHCKGNLVPAYYTNHRAFWDTWPPPFRILGSICQATDPKSSFKSKSKLQRHCLVILELIIIGLRLVLLMQRFQGNEQGAGFALHEGGIQISMSL
jgi:hypothetical protein